MASIIPILKRIRTSPTGFTGTQILIALAAGPVQMDALASATALSVDTIRQQFKQLRIDGYMTSKISTHASYELTKKGQRHVADIVSGQAAKSTQKATAKATA